MWDVIKPGEVVDLVVRHLTEGGDRSSVAKLLVDSAKSAGSNDNISVVVVFLDSHKKDVPHKDTSHLCDNALSTDVQHVSFDDNVTNSTENGTSENIKSKNTGENSPVPSPKLSPNSPKDGNTLEEQNSLIACNKSASPSAAT